MAADEFSSVASFMNLTFPNAAAESKGVVDVIKTLRMMPHIEGGYFAETDRDAAMVTSTMIDGQTVSRNASTSIFYFLDTTSPLGAFHRNKARTVHTLHRGRGRYIIIHADEAASDGCRGGYGQQDIAEQDRWKRKARVESFDVGHNIRAGERLQWIVEGGKYKCSYLLPDIEGEDTSQGLLISETVVPGFEYDDHDFMKADRMQALLTPEQYSAMQWTLRK